MAIGLDVERDQLGIEPVGGALGGAHGIGGGGAGIEADDHPLAGRPRAGNGMLAHVAQHLPVDAFGGAAQRQLAQGRQVAGREVVAQRALGLLADIDLALAQALHQVGRREIDQLDLVGSVDDAVGHRLAHADAGDARHHVVQALDMLHVHRRVDVDAGAQKLLDVEIALGMAAAGGVGVGELVDQDQRRPALQDGVEVHLLEDAAAILDLAPRHHLEAGELGLGLGAAVGLDDTDHDVDALFPAPARRLQHLVGLADARRGAEEDFQLAARFLLRRLQESVGRGAGIFTQGRHGRSLSPLGQRVEGQIEPQHVDPRLAQHAQNRGLSVYCPTRRCRSASCRPRALATRGTCQAAAAGEICGSRPLAEVVTRSTGTPLPSFSASPLTRSISAFEVGPRFEPEELAAS